jgi:hypothetical protein
MRREFKIMEVNYNPIKGDEMQEKPLIKKNPKSVGLEVSCDFNKSFKNLTKET